MPTKNHQVNLVSELLSRGIEEIIPSEESLKEALLKEEKLTVYLGVDPTGPQLHLGHSVPLLLLKRFQKLGHKVILLIGDFTARIGDPSGKDSARISLSKEEVFKNLGKYKEQAGKILDFNSPTNPATLSFNSKWLEELTLEKVVEISSAFTVQQMLARDMFQRRIKEEKPIALNEFLYPILQGYDSVALYTDIEVGASDQLFNMLIGRDLVKRYLNKEKLVITTKILANPVTGAKMSKSEGRFIALDDAPKDMYGGIMAFPDELIQDCLELCTEISMKDIAEIIKMPPRDSKARLAREIVAMYHGAEKASSAEAEFNKVFKFHQPSQDMGTTVMVGGATSTTTVLLKTGFSKSKGEAKRLEEQRGVHVQMSGSKEWQTAGDTIDVKDGTIIRVGKRKFIKLKIKN